MSENVGRSHVHAVLRMGGIKRALLQYRLNVHAAPQKNRTLMDQFS